MRVALAITHPKHSKKRNIAEIIRYTKQAAKEKADFILFPEAAYTGLIIKDNPRKDKPLFISIPGKITNKIGKTAKKFDIYVGIGLLEICGNKFFDSAVLFDRNGKISLKYQRITTGWHAENTDKNIYQEGVDIPIQQTPYGTIAFLLCGDLFDEAIVNSIKKMKIDYLFLLLARSLEISDEKMQILWDTEISEGYIPQIKKAEITTFIVNYYSTTFTDNNSIPCGGAAAISAKGDLIIDFPVLKNGLLFVDL
ncbi:MAG TPA: carbon-nitrogen hydrolase family protein [Candidatus Glassbacteria bacterium]|nr:carbon-nitrogen hydrolase family protein [Candidatus Glassbacteria bacterium]